ncbi:hypothetical protein ACS0TY_022179 [Phlomoides rotata]
MCIALMSHHCISGWRSLCRGFRDLEACNRGKLVTKNLASEKARSFITFGVIGLIKHLLQPQIPHIVLRIFCFKVSIAAGMDSYMFIMVFHVLMIC